RSRGGVPLSDRDPAARVRQLRARRDDRLRGAAVGRVRVRVAPGRARVEVRAGPLSAPTAARSGPAGEGDTKAMRVRTTGASELLRGAELEGPNRPAQLEQAALERHVRERVLTTTLEEAVAWARSNSFFPLAFGLACCAMEQFHTAGPRMDIPRFGS